MIYRQGNIFLDVAEILVCPTNGVGVLGKGLALQFAQQFPDTPHHYVKACQNGGQSPGRLLFVDSKAGYTVCFFPTKRHWRDKSRLEDIELGLEALRDYLSETPRSVALPAIGCGLGGLRWEDVRPIIEQYLSSYDVRVYDP